MEQRRAALRGVVAAIVEPAATLTWEVGSGHGHFLTAYAKAHPDEPCIGVDISSYRVARATRKRDRAKLANLHFIRADAEDFLAVLPEAARFSSVFILFPDPWPKRRHHKNRVVTPGFLSSIARRSPKGSPLYFRTDHEPYFREVSGIVRSHPAWLASEQPAWPIDEPTVFQKRSSSHFTLVAVRR
jgi:tRNA (guanine-N7-)-methyltransferase